MHGEFGDGRDIAQFFDIRMSFESGVILANFFLDHLQAGERAL